MATSTLPEVWLRGPLPNLHPLLQPVAHALLQVQEELATLLHDFPEALLWEKPAGLASVGFHLKHLSGVPDRLFTYALGKPLSAEQQAYLKQEGTPGGTVQHLLQAFEVQVAQALAQLRTADAATLTEARPVGRMQLPATVLGLYVHAAEHCMRHLGQLLVTVAVLKAQQDLDKKSD